MARRRPRRCARGGEDISTLRANGTRLATGVGAVALLASVAVVPVVRADGTMQNVSVRVGAVAFVVLIAGVALGWSSLVPAAVVLACGGYAAELAIDDAPLDAVAPVLAAAVLVSAELAYWSLEERERATGDPGENWRHAAFVAGLGLCALVVGSLLLALVDAVHTRSLALDVTGALAAAGALAVVLLVSGGRGSSGH